MPLAPGMSRANRGTKNKLIFLKSKTTRMTASGKTFQRTRQPDATTQKIQANLRPATINVGMWWGYGVVAKTVGRLDIMPLQKVKYKN